MTQIRLREYQQAGVDGIRAALARKKRAVLFVLPTGGGKCLAAGTPVLMHDGTIKPIEKITAGERIMGPDSQPRTVLSTCTGREMMYKVTPTKGDPYVVNESHILSLKITGTSDRVRGGDGRMYLAGDIVNISIPDYLKSSSTFKHVAKGWRTGVEFAPSASDRPIPAYILGIWLGDGTEKHRIEITNPDQPVIEAWTGWGESIGCRVVVRNQQHTDCNTYTLCGVQSNGCLGRSNPARNLFNDLGVFGNRHIPLQYKTASRQDRLELLAGIVDTDGYLHHGSYEVVAKKKEFADDIAFLARSLGFACYVKPCQKTCTNTGAVGDYFRLVISGDISVIPVRVERRKADPRRQKKDVLVTGIKVEPVGEGDYYGFEIDGDHLFVLGDFTVTHNTYTFCYIADSAAQRGNNIYIIVHRKELLLQASKSLKNLGIDHGMISPHFTPALHKRVQVASVDTLLRRIEKHPDKYRPTIVIYDEAHHVVDGNKWGKVYKLLGEPVMLGFTATPERGDGVGLGRQCGGLFDEMVIGPTIKELIEMGNLLNPMVYVAPESSLPDFSGLKKNKDGEISEKDEVERVDRPVITGCAVEHYSRICPGARAIVFCRNIQHARNVVAAFNEAGFRFSLLVGEPAMSDKERTRVIEMMESGELDGAVTVDLVSEGFDLPALECCIMLRRTGSVSLFLQQVGRVLRPSEGKTVAYLLDHVGNVGRTVDGKFVPNHGFPDADRDWSLEGKKKKRRGQTEVQMALKQCPQCFHVFEPADTCPKCGHDVRPKSAQIEQVDGELQLLTSEEAAAISKQKRIDVGKAQSMEELLQIEKQRGYKPGWARMVFEARKRKKGGK